MNGIKTFVKQIANNFGFRILRVSKITKNSKFSAYQTVIPYATYNPWNVDSLFNQTYTAIQGFTLVDKYRCFELWKLVEQSSKLSDGAIIEIGVWRGGTGALMAKQAKVCGIPSQVYLCDTFTGVVKAGSKDSSYIGGEHSDTSREAVDKFVFKQMNLDNVQILQGVFPDQTSHKVKDLQFRFCHIDVDVYQSAKDIVEWIWGRIVPGGIVVFDDYGFQGCEGITKYVEEQMLNKDRLVLHNINGHAIFIKL